MNKIELQKSIMLNNDRWWNVNDLTEVVREACKRHGLKSINHATVERNIRHFREPKHFLDVQKRKVSDNTWEYKITSRYNKKCSASEYAKAKGE